MDIYKVTLTPMGSSGPVEKIFEAFSEKQAIEIASEQFYRCHIHKAEKAGALEALLYWMDNKLGHDLTNIAINTTVISRSVDYAFSQPSLREYSELAKPITILLQCGFDRQYRKKDWKSIIYDQLFSHHVKSNFASFKNINLREAQSAIVIVMKKLNEDQQQGY